MESVTRRVMDDLLVLDTLARQVLGRERVDILAQSDEGGRTRSLMWYYWGADYANLQFP